MGAMRKICRAYRRRQCGDQQKPASITVYPTFRGQLLRSVDDPLILNALVRNGDAFMDRRIIAKAEF